MFRLTLLLLALMLVLAPAAQARTCRDGDTVYQRAGVRVFEDGPRTYDAWFACGPRTRRPVRLYATDVGYGSFEVLWRRDGRVIFTGTLATEGGSAYTTLGWFDGRRARSGDLAGVAANEVLDVVVAADGGIGVVASTDGDDGTRVGYLAPGRDELGLAVVGGRYAKRSLAFADRGRKLTWRRADGQARSVPVTGERVTCTSGTTLLEHENTRVFEVLPNRRYRGSQADVLAACEPGAAVPRELAVTTLEDQDHWPVRSLKRAGSRAAFLTGTNGVGFLEGSALTFTRPKAVTDIDDVAVGRAGPLLVAGDTAELENVVARLDGHAVASLGGEIKAGSLAVTDDGRVSWLTAAGAAQGVPVGGETAPTCASGTTLLHRDGLRVFEVLAGGPQLLGCAPGATAPTVLRTGRQSSRILELARERGLVALYVIDREDAVVSFGPAGVRVGTPGPSAAYAGIRDAAIAPDGRVALALRQGARWTITAFDSAGRERVLARPEDGVTPGSLGFDGVRVSWQSRSGAARGANP